jgi:rhodanese-related sulfurtransferase
MFNFNKSSRGHSDLTYEDFYKGLKNKDSVILDVRNLEEYNSGRIPNAIQLDIMSSTFVDQLGEFPRNKSYFVYCRSGKRSAQACELMSEIGFSKVYNMVGGIMAWPYEIVR